MGNIIEVEKRGLLTQKTKKDLKIFLAKNASFIREFDQLSIFCETSGELLGTVKAQRVSIAISILNIINKEKRSCSLKIKNGSIEDQFKREIEIPFLYQDLSKIFKFFELLGIEEGCPRFYHRLDFCYMDLLISVKDLGLIPDHFEIEKKVNRPEEVNQAELFIMESVKKMGLCFLSEKDYRSLMINMYEQNPPIKLKDINVSAFFE